MAPFVSSSSVDPLIVDTYNLLSLQFDVNEDIWVVEFCFKAVQRDCLVSLQCLSPDVRCGSVNWLHHVALLYKAGMAAFSH